MGWLNPTYPEKEVDIHLSFYFAYDPTHFVEEIGRGIQISG